MKKIGPNKWLVRVVWNDPRQQGKRKDRRRICEGTRRDAERFRQEMLAELEAESGAQPRVTLSAYAQRWLEQRVPRLKHSTIDGYMRDLEMHILPALGGYFVDELRPGDIRAWMGRQLKKYAPGYVRGQVLLLRTIAGDAVADGFTERNFTERVEAPPAKEYTEDEPNLLTADELSRVMARISEYWRAAAAAMAFTGMRWCEVSALKWDDVDFEVGVIHIRRAQVKGILGEPKTPKSRRRVPMVPELAAVLKWHRQRMLQSQHPGLRHGWLFPTRRGELHKGTPLNRELRRALKEAEVATDLTPHGLRRTFNNLARQVASGQVVRSIVGHSTEAMTEHYSVVGMDEKHHVASSVLRLVSGSSGGTPGSTSPEGA